jgi:membrane protease subunit HflK
MDPKDLKNKFFKYTSRFMGGIIIVVIVFLFATMGWYTVTGQERAVVTTAGRYTTTTEAGLRFKIPILQRAHKVNMTIQGMELNYSSQPQAAQTFAQMFDRQENLMITNDFNIVSVDFYAEWRVTDPRKYLFNSERPMYILKYIIQSSARDIISAYNVDSVLTDGRFEIQTNVRELVNNVLNDYDIGMMVTNNIIQDAEPPTEEVVLAFKSVEDARQRRETLINEANRYFNENIPFARAEADGIIRSAEAVREGRINEATGQVARFNEMFNQYIRYPEITRTRMYLETIEEVMPGMTVFIDSTDGGNLLKMLDLVR